MPSKICSAIESALREVGVFPERVVIGVSGGADSLALFGGAVEARDTLGQNLVVAHFDHHLRAESSEDADYVDELCRRFDVACRIGHWNQSTEIALGRGGIEESARDARYAFFANVVETTGSAAVLTGHTAQDQTETRLLHVVRGSGLRGLRGMTIDSSVTARSGAKVRVIRPLLSCTRADTVAHCRARGIEPRIDPSNADASFARNRLRHKAVPQLMAINPRLDSALSRLGRIATDADDFIESELERRLPTLLRGGVDRWEIDRFAWRDLPRALKRALVRRAVASIQPDTDIGAEAVEAVIQTIDVAPAGTLLTLANARVLRISHDRAIVESSTRPRGRFTSVTIALDNDSLSMLGRFARFDWRRGSYDWETDPAAIGIRIRHRTSPCVERHRDRWHVDVDRATLGTDLTLLVRSRLNGDFLFPEGMEGRKKVQDLFVDAKVPQEVRDLIPILATPAGRIAWVVGLRRDRGILAGHSSTDVLCVEVVEPEQPGTICCPA